MHESNLSEADFITRYEQKAQPVILAGLADKWPARQRWNMTSLMEDFR